MLTTVLCEGLLVSPVSGWYNGAVSPLLYSSNEEEENVSRTRGQIILMFLILRQLEQQPLMLPLQYRHLPGSIVLPFLKESSGKRKRFVLI
jgi:hypothetical protein